MLSANSPQQVTLVDCAHILYSDDGGIQIDTSDEATIQMNDAPTIPGRRHRIRTAVAEKPLGCEGDALDRVSAGADGQRGLHDGGVLVIRKQVNATVNLPMVTGRATAPRRVAGCDEP